MKSLKFLGFIFLMPLSTFVMQGQPQFDSGVDPKPAGKSWEIVGNMSDDFNDNTFNTTKWHKWRDDDGAGNSDWIGRPSGLFKNWAVTKGADPNVL